MKNQNGKIETKSVDDVLTIIQNSDYCDFRFHFVFRGDNYIPKSKFRRSRVHADDCEGKLLKGVSAIFVEYGENIREDVIEAIARAKRYGEHVYLLEGEITNADEEYNDYNEVCVLNHKIVCMVNTEGINTI